MGGFSGEILLINPLLHLIFIIGGYTVNINNVFKDFMIGGKEYGRVVLVTPSQHIINFTVIILIP
jgi:hypothetical protein